MKQILQDLSSGETVITECPVPVNKPGNLLINSVVSLISIGTERMLVEFSQAGYIAKARQQPEKVAEVLSKVKTDGLLTTVDAVRSKLSHPIPLGYSNVGVVYSVGSDVTGFKVGDRVVSNGPHADVVDVPKNLCALIPDNVDDEAACFTVVGAIALQGVRLAKPAIGETFVVIGVGLVGLLTVQILVANGCKVLAIDFDDTKLELAKKFGAEICNPARGNDPVAAGQNASSGRGVDGVIITASTKSSDPVSQAAQMSRKRGRIILVGVTGLTLNRSEFYEKEISFQVSCSYGPGRYDTSYENEGHDYPVGFVRWTEQRNFEAILDLMSLGKIDTVPLITHRNIFSEAVEAYETIGEDKSALGILLQYQHDVESRHQQTISFTDNAPSPPPTQINRELGNAVFGVIGAGNYSSRVLLPAFRQTAAIFHTIASSGGTSSAVHGKKLGFQYATTDTDELIANPEVNVIVVATQHNSHAKFAQKALKSGKHVFVEKPLGLKQHEIDLLESNWRESCVSGAPLQIMVGYNRRFAPLVKKAKKLLDTITCSKSFIMTVNAGFLPADHWTQNPEVGGGRIVGEACHHIDLMRFFTGSQITNVSVVSMRSNTSGQIKDDISTINLEFADGSFGAIHYFANGPKNFPKERIEIFADSRMLQIDNYRKLKAFGWPGIGNKTLLKIDKGQSEMAKLFVEAVKSGVPVIPADEIFEVARASIMAAELARKN